LLYLRSTYTPSHIIYNLRFVGKVITKHINMPSWDSIEDATTMLPRVWLTRAKDGDVWKPLRKIDCKALNESRGMYNIICCNYVKICTCIII